MGNIWVSVSNDESTKLFDFRLFSSKKNSIKFTIKKQQNIKWEQNLYDFRSKGNYKQFIWKKEHNKLHFSPVFSYFLKKKPNKNQKNTIRWMNYKLTCHKRGWEGFFCCSSSFSSFFILCVTWECLQKKMKHYQWMKNDISDIIN